VRREVTRVLTPGTLLDDGMLNARRNNYLAAVWSLPETIGLGIQIFPLENFSPHKLVIWAANARIDAVVAFGSASADQCPRLG